MNEKDLEKFLAATALGLLMKGQIGMLMLPAPTIKPVVIKNEVVFATPEKENGSLVDKVLDFSGNYQIRFSSVVGTFNGSAGSVVGVIGLPIIPTL